MCEGNKRNRVPLRIWGVHLLSLWITTAHFSHPGCARILRQTFRSQAGVSRSLFSRDGHNSGWLDSRHAKSLFLIIQVNLSHVHHWPQLDTKSSLDSKWLMSLLESYSFSLSVCLCVCVSSCLLFFAASCLAAWGCGGNRTNWQPGQRDGCSSRYRRSPSFFCEFFLKKAIDSQLNLFLEMTLTLESKDSKFGSHCVASSAHNDLWVKLQVCWLVMWQTWAQLLEHIPAF